jgi:hypothetical protein
MAANTNPIFTRQGDVQWAQSAGLSANTSKVGAGTLGTDIFAVFVADATEGGFVRAIVCKPLGSNIQTLVRVFVNNGGANGTAANNAFFKDATLPLTTNSETVAQPDIEIPINIALPPGYRLLVTVATAVAAGWTFTADGGKY